MESLVNWPAIKIGAYTVHIASTSPRKQQGLQFITSLPARHLVLFPDIPAKSYFHTVNCLFPIDIVSLNSNNIVLTIVTATPNKKLVGPTPIGTTSVVEGPTGWVKEAGIHVGMELMGALKRGK